MDLRGRLNLPAAPGLARLARRIDAHAIHYHGTRAGLPGSLAARMAGARSLYTVHGWACHPRSHEVQERLAREIERTIVRWTDMVICVSEGDRQTASALGLIGPGSCRVIPNGVDTEVFAALEGGRRRARIDLGLGSATRAIGVVGRLTHQKGQDLLLDAAPTVLAQCPDAAFVLIGDGEDRQSLLQRAGRLGISRHVKLVGTRRDIPAVLAALDVFALPSRWEGMPISLLEAMASGRPVIATAVTGSREAIEDGRSGLLIPPDDPQALARAILSILSDGGFAAGLADAARRRVRALYSVGPMVAATASLYEELLAGAGQLSGARP